MSNRVTFAALFLILAGGTLAAAEDARLPVLAKEDFEHGFSRWQTTDPDQLDQVAGIGDQGKSVDSALRDRLNEFRAR